MIKVGNRSLKSSLSDKVIFVFMVLLIFIDSTSQDIGKVKEQLKKTKPIKITGGFNTSLKYYDVNGIEGRRPPFVYSLNANVGFSLYGIINCSFAVNYNNKQTDLELDNAKTIIEGIINKTGISPKYKSITLHLGERSMKFSPLTYSGLMFYGIGIEVKPKKSWINVSAFRGRLQKATLPVDVNVLGKQPAYKRMGYGMRLGFGNKNRNIGFSLFHAEDDIKSLSFIREEVSVKPMENLVVGMFGRSKIGKKFDFKFEYNISALTPDTRKPKSTTLTDYSYFNNIGSLFTPRSSQYSKALVLSSEYNYKFFGVGVKYRKIDPGYRSLGSLGIQNDIEDYTLNGKLLLFNGKVNLDGSYGKQRDNLKEQLMLTNQQYISSLKLSYLVNSKLSFILSYSDFNTNTSPSYLNVRDTLRLMQINGNLGFNTTYTFGGKNTKQTLMFSTEKQKTEDIQEFGVDSSIVNTSGVFNNILNYNISLKKYKTTIGLSLLYNDVEVADMINTSRGISILAKRKFLKKKIKTGLTIAYLQTLADGDGVNNTLNLKSTFEYKINKYHLIKINNAIVVKDDLLDSEKSFTEYQGSISYRFKF